MPAKQTNAKKSSPRGKLGDLTFKINYGIMKVDTSLALGHPSAFLT